MASMPADVAQIDDEDQIDHKPWCDVEEHEAQNFIRCSGPSHRFGAGSAGWITDDGDIVRYVLITPGSGLRMDRDLIDALLAELIAARGAM